LIDGQPGWLYEANGVLHPRGSEYAVQFVVDGVPLNENRSPAFAPNFESDDVESMRVFTAGYPAEYGRKLGGVVELSSPKDTLVGLHGDAAIGGGSFDSTNGSGGLMYGWGANHLAATGYGSRSDRYLDPPVLDNFTNSGSAGGGSLAYSRDFSDRDRLRVKITHSAVHFEVPNELVQENAGQRQDRTSLETSGLIYYQRVMSPALLFDAQGSVRDDSASLWSNLQSTPIIAAQRRGFREGYARIDLAWHRGHHDLKIGADAIMSSIHEALQYNITYRSQFDPDTRRRFNFLSTASDLEEAAFVQDSFHAHNWNVSAGIRFDHYRLLTEANAWTPRWRSPATFSRWECSCTQLTTGPFRRPRSRTCYWPARQPPRSSMTPYYVCLCNQAARTFMRLVYHARFSANCGWRPTFFGAISATTAMMTSC
jgi:hypothetical protein